MGVAEEGEADDVGVAGEQVCEVVRGEELFGRVAGAEAEELAGGGVEVDAGWDVTDDPDLFVVAAG